MIPAGSLNPFYVTGLSEGEATFTYIRNGGGINLRYAMKLTEADRNLVFALQAFFATGQVYRVGATMGSTTRAGWMYCATSMASLQRIVQHFDVYRLWGKKYDEYLIWRQMYTIKQTPRKIDLPQLTSLAEKLSALRTKGRRYLKQNRWTQNV